MKIDIKSFNGDLTRICNQLSQCYSSGVLEIFLDFIDVYEIDPEMAFIICRAHERCLERNIRFYLINVCDHIEAILEMTNLDDTILKGET